MVLISAPSINGKFFNPRALARDPPDFYFCPFVDGKFPHPLGDIITVGRILPGHDARSCMLSAKLTTSIVSSKVISDKKPINRPTIC